MVLKNSSKNYIYYTIFLIFSQIPSIGAINGELGLNFIGIVVLSHVVNLKFKRSFVTATLDCIMPNLMPLTIKSKLLLKTICTVNTHMQFRWPSPNGKKVNGVILLTFSSLNLSGSKI